MDKVSALMPSTVEKAVNGTPIAMVVKVVDPLRIEAFIAFELTTKVADMFNGDQRLNLQGHQIPVIAKTLMETFKSESLADFSVCFKRGAMGFYNDGQDKLLRIDGSVIVQWMRKYLEEKYQIIEAQLMSEKESFYAVKKATKTEDQPNPDRNLLSLLKTVIGDVRLPETNNAKENEIQRNKLVYTSPNEDYIKAHQQRIRDCQEKALRDKYPSATDEQIKQLIEKL